MFNLFANDPYTFLKLESKTGGNAVITQYQTQGVVKLRDGMLQADNMETRQATSTVHIKPTEAFVADLGANLVGHGIRVSKGDYEVANYRIESQVEGYDFDSGTLEFYKVTLKRENLWDESDLPLE
jgi:hypothetical protein